MRERTVIVDAPSFEQRMIGWRVGWIVMPSRLTDFASRAQIYNGLVASGFAQIGVRVALSEGDHDVAAATAEWQLRRDETLRQLDGLPVVPPHGAWSALLDAQALGLAPAELSARLLEHKVAATPMDGWGGEIAARYLRFVFSKEPVDRLGALGGRVRAALG
jgi:N-succinyldiaminopimelate aminotransferase